MLQKKPKSWLSRAAVVIGLGTALLISGCGDSGGGSDNPTSKTSTDLKGALNTTLEAAPVVSHTLSRQDGTKIEGANVVYRSEMTGLAGFNLALIDAAVATTNIDGVASLAVPADKYTRMLSNTPTDAVAGEGSAVVSYPVSISTDGTKTYQADQYAFDITSDTPLSSVALEIYQTDAAGNTDHGTGKYVVLPMDETFIIGTDIKNPLVFDVSTPPSMLDPQSATINAELFEGTYRFVVRATPTDSTKHIAPYMSQVITVDGNKLAVPTQVPTLSAGSGNALTVTLKDSNGNPVTGRNIWFRDTNTRILLGVKTTDASGVATQLVGSDMTKVIAEVSNASNTAMEALYQFNNITDSVNAVTLQQYTISGKLTPSSGSLKTTPSTVTASLNTGLGVAYDRDNVVNAVLTASDGLGGYTIKLFGVVGGEGLSYKLSAYNVTDFPDVTPLTIDVAADMVDQNINVAPGGVIFGKVEEENGTDLQGVTVFFLRTENDGTLSYVTSKTTDSLGDYTVQVAYGNYILFVGGAVTEGIKISSSNTTVTRNIKRYQLTGRITLDQGGTKISAANATVHAGTMVDTTDGVGVYTVNLMSGKNWICARPSVDDISYGYGCTVNVLVDEDTVAAARE